MRKRKLLLVPALSLLLAACQRQQTADNKQDSAAQAEQRAQQAEQTAKEARELADRAHQQANEAEQRALETRQRSAQQQASRAQQKADDAEQKLAQRRQQDGHSAAQNGRAPSQDGRQLQERPEMAERPAQRAPEQLQVPAGVAFNVRLDEPLDTSKNKDGDTFTATLDQPVTVNDRVAIPAGTRFTGSVVTSEESGRLSGEGVLTVTLNSFELNGRQYCVSTSEITKKTGGHAKRNTAIIGGGTGAGAAIGGIAGGKRGAAIGAGAGAAAGTAGAAATGKLNVRLPAETVLNFTLESPVQVRS